MKRGPLAWARPQPAGTKDAAKGASHKGTQRFGRSEKRLAAVLVALVVAAAIGAHFASSKAASWRAKASEDQAQAAQANAAWQLGQKVHLAGRRWEARLAADKVALPTGEAQAAFVRDMAATTRACGTTWSSSSWALGSGAGGQSWVVELALSGPEGAVTCVVHRLGRLARAVTVTDVALSFEGPVVQASVSLDVFARGAK